MPSIQSTIVRSCICTLLAYACGSSQELRRAASATSIGSIRIERRAIFDPRDTATFNFIGSVANSLHTLTRERIIRNELLFREGESYDPRLLEESERNLRRMGIIGEVSIRRDSASSDIIVETHDRWTIALGASYKQDGGVRSFALSLSDDNFLGNAQSVAVNYNYRSDRTRRYGTEVYFLEPQLFGSRWHLELQHKNSEDVRIVTALCERPFFSEDASWAFGAYADNGSSRRRLYAGGVEVLNDDVRQNSQNLWTAASFGEGSKIRMGVAWKRARSSTSVPLAQPTDNVDLVTVSAGYLHRVWTTQTFLNSLERVEDLPKGIAFGGIFGRNVGAIDVGNMEQYVRVSGSAAFQPWPGGYCSPQISYDAYSRIAGPDETTWRWALLMHQRFSDASLTLFQLSGIVGSGWSPGRQLTLGSPTGLRGYSAFEFAGNSMALLNVEQRWKTDLAWWIFRFGGAAFVDCGTVWHERDAFSRQRLHASAGIGLRIENTKQQGAGIVRVDVAYNFDRRTLSEIIITSRQLIPAFNPVETVAPNESQ